MTAAQFSQDFDFLQAGITRPHGAVLITSRFFAPVLTKTGFTWLAWIVTRFFVVSRIIGTVWAPQNEGKSLGQFKWSVGDCTLPINPPMAAPAPWSDRASRVARHAPRLRISTVSVSDPRQSASPSTISEFFPGWSRLEWSFPPMAVHCPRQSPGGRSRRSSWQDDAQEPSAAPHRYTRI